MSEMFYRILDLLFGGWIHGFLGGSGDAGVATVTPLTTVLAYMNLAAMLFAAVVIGFFGFGSTVNMASRGTILGEGWDGAGTVLSSALVAGMLFPVSTNVFSGAAVSPDARYISTAQASVLYIAALGNDIAEQIWQAGVNQFDIQGGVPAVAAGNLPFVLDAYRMALCAMAAPANYDHENPSRPYGNSLADDRAFMTRYEIDYYDSNDNLQSIAFESTSNFKVFLQRNTNIIKRIDFGEGKCGTVELPGKEKKKKTNSQDEDTLKGYVAALMYAKRNEAHAQADKALRQLFVDMIDVARIHFGYILQTDDSGIVGRWSELIKQGKASGDQKQKIVDLVNGILTAGVKYYTALMHIGQDDSAADSTSNDDEGWLTQDLEALIKSRGWMSAGVWMGFLSSLSQSTQDIKTGYYAPGSYNANSFLCYATLVDRAQSLIGKDLPCQFHDAVGQNKGSNNALGYWSEFTLQLYNHIIKVKQPQYVERFFGKDAYIGRECKTLDGNCSARPYERALDGYTRSLMYYMWSPGEYGLDKPRNPFVATMHAGLTAINTAAILKLLSTPVEAKELVAKARAKKGLAGYVLALIASALGSFVTMLHIAIVFMLTTGYLLVFVIPLIPAVHWVMFLLSYAITIVLAFAALPVALAMITIPTEQGWRSPKKQRVVQILAAVLLKPALGVIAIFAAYGLATVGFALFDEFFFDAIATSDVTADFAGDFTFVRSFIAPLAYLIITTSVAIGIVRYSFSLIHLLPSQVLAQLDWFSDRVFGESFPTEFYSDQSNRTNDIVKIFETVGESSKSKSKGDA
ncbi:MAG: hypothetical protein D6712_06095 [Chloroflexi bacterium]|nr:MAG: hypothetical protein D6712_06095 [Chloroflexota bacterium]